MGKLKCLILFSGTKSIEKVFERFGHECRGVDIDNFFKPYYNVNILEWDYKNINWIPDYIHASPICKEFTPIKNIGLKRDLELGNDLVDKTIEIIKYFEAINKDIKFTIENPRGLLRKYDKMLEFTRFETSYCKYGFPYRKNTDFWSNFPLNLENKCKKDCDSIDEHGRHLVRICGFNSTYNMICSKYFKILKKRHNSKYKDWDSKHMRYRIPEGLVKDILLSLY